MPRNTDALKARLREVIVQRFRESRIAGDTAHGIHTSWLPEHGLEAASLQIVDSVLADLVREKVLRTEPVTGGDPLFKRGAKFPESKRR